MYIQNTDQRIKKLPWSFVLIYNNLFKTIHPSSGNVTSLFSLKLISGMAEERLFLLCSSWKSRCQSSQVFHLTMSSLRCSGLSMDSHFLLSSRYHSFCVSLCLCVILCEFLRWQPCQSFNGADMTCMRIVLPEWYLQ